MDSTELLFPQMALGNFTKLNGAYIWVPGETPVIAVNEHLNELKRWEVFLKVLHLHFRLEAGHPLRLMSFIFTDEGRLLSCIEVPPQ